MPLSKESQDILANQILMKTRTQQYSFVMIFAGFLIEVLFTNNEIGIRFPFSEHVNISSLPFLGSISDQLLNIGIYLTTLGAITYFAITLYQIYVSRDQLRRLE